MGIGSTLNPGPEPAADARVRLGALRRGLRDLGYEEGKNIIIEYRTAAGKRERIPGIIAELAQLKTDVIIWSATQEDAKQIKTIPIVYVGTTDFVATGLVWKALRGQGATLRPVEARGPDDMEKTFSAMSHDRVEGLSTAAGPINNTSRLRITQLVALIGVLAGGRGPERGRRGVSGRPWRLWLDRREECCNRTPLGGAD